LSLFWKGEILIWKTDQAGRFCKMLVETEDGKTRTTGNAKTAADTFLFMEHWQMSDWRADGDGAMRTGTFTGIAGDFLTAFNAGDSAAFQPCFGRHSGDSFHVCSSPFQ